MLDGLSLVSIRECSMDANGPIQVPSSCVRDIHLSEMRFVEADIGFLAGIPTIIRLEISITRAKQACEFPAAHTVVHFVLHFCAHILLCIFKLCSRVHQRMLDGRPMVSIRECSMDTSGPIPSSCAAETDRKSVV